MKDKVRTWINSRYRVSFSKSGEDIQLFKLLNKFQGKYLDIGCFEPITFSNTYYFYLKGWNGFVVDPNPRVKSMFSTIRPKDQFIQRGISSYNGKLTYYMLKENLSSMNTFNYDFLVANNLTNYIESQIEVPLCTLEELVDDFDLYNKIDFLDVDVEGLDFEVLSSNNWEKFRPSLIMVETDLSLEEDLNSPIYQLLKEKDYKILAKLVQETNGSGNLIFCRSDYSVNPK
ncbi:FkbM family methyltransferase [Algoriphagus limi]|uniref:FkbM family methyltransferase n=1 Tax=Algoriphagus limi TaxID=2975273 RepID=A0ABT2G132_9BACT|nr:FkbM family methyltransferase [Algoriphagus limi]MCS5488979.1 FkbM family methyltransferase [Algoriphagus limi]